MLKDLGTLIDGQGRRIGFNGCSTFTGYHGLVLVAIEPGRGRDHHHAVGGSSVVNGRISQVEP